MGTEQSEPESEVISVDHTNAEIIEGFYVLLPINKCLMKGKAFKPSLPSFNVTAIILSYTNYRGEVYRILQRLSH